MARPTPNNPTGAQKSPKRTPATINLLEQAFAIDSSVKEACFFAGISIQCYYDWVKVDPKLAERLNALREKPVLTARNTVVKALVEPDHARWYLERKRPKEFGNKIQHGGELNANITITSAVAERLERSKKARTSAAGAQAKNPDA